MLFSTLTEETVEDAFHYYRTFYNAPPGIKVRNVAPKGLLEIARPNSGRSCA